MNAMNAVFHVSMTMKPNHNNEGTKLSVLTMIKIKNVFVYNSSQLQ